MLLLSGNKLVGNVTLSITLLHSKHTWHTNRPHPSQSAINTILLLPFSWLDLKFINGFWLLELAVLTSGMECLASFPPPQSSLTLLYKLCPETTVSCWLSPLSAHLFS